MQNQDILYQPIAIWEIIIWFSVVLRVSNNLKKLFFYIIQLNDRNDEGKSTLLYNTAGQQCWKCRIEVVKGQICMSMSMALT